MGNNKEKIERIMFHMKHHPRDYQSKISLLKLQSRQLEWEDRQAMIPRLQRLSEIRRHEH